jgi:spore coat polysaccharide biosynthesis protein SpsF
MNIVATIQARMGSSRLPGKVLVNVCNKPMLLWQIERIRRSRLINDVVVATSKSSLDDEIEKFCIDNKIICYRGSEDDVLQRISSLLRDLKVDLHVECHGDSPLIDPQIIDEFIGYWFKHNQFADYFSSALKTTYPPGSEVTVYHSKVLLTTNELVAYDDPLREHVGFNITRFPEKFKLCSLEAPPWLFAPEIYLEVDVEDDLYLVRSIFTHFIELNQEHFSLGEILKMLRNNSKLTKVNDAVIRRWKVLREKNSI